MIDVQLVAIDLDGTLLDRAKRIHPASIAAIHQIRELGIPVILATGRTFGSAAPYAKILSLDTPIIAHGGAYIATLHEDEPWSERCMQTEIASALLNCLEQHEYYIKVYVGNHLFVQHDTEETAQFSALYQVPYTAVGSKGLSKLKLRPHKIAVIDTADRIAQAFTLLEPWNRDCELIHDSPNGMEILAAGASKGNAMAYLCDRLHIPLANAMAFGNEGNDISMIKMAGVGVAMGNSYDKLKEVADIIAKSNEEQGVADILIQYIVKRQQH